MWLPDRRTFLISLAALGGCGFTPVYGPQGGGSALLDNVALPEPDSPEQYLLHRRLEERLDSSVVHDRNRTPRLR